MDTNLFQLIDQLAEEKTNVFSKISGMKLAAHVAISRLENHGEDVKDLIELFEKFGDEKYSNMFNYKGATEALEELQELKEKEKAIE